MAITDPEASGTPPPPGERDDLAALELTNAAPDPVGDLEEQAARAQLRAEMFGDVVDPPRVGRFAVQGRLGAGAMGVVYAGHDDNLDRPVAIKVIGPDAAGNAEARERMLREAQALARINHPNVVQIYDVGDHAGGVFLAMELVEGITLSAWLAQRERKWSEVVRVFSHAGRGLAAAHREGLIHRDFKPDNVMVGSDGRVRVMDFGLARAPRGVPASPIVDRADATPRSDALRTDLTGAGSVLGTPAYMAPEQHLGLETDARTDQFSFCVALYEGVYGRRPFSGKSLASLADNVTRGAALPAPDDTSVPGWLGQIVARGLATQPEDRFASMDELLTAVGRDPARRRRRALIVGGTVAVAVTGVGLFAASAVRPPLCEGMSERLAGIWDDERREAVHTALLATGAAYADDTSNRVRHRLDGYADAWVEARTDACEATRVRGEQTDQLMDKRIACYDARLRELGAMVGVLSAADETIVQQAVPAASNLSRLERCANVDALTAEVPRPDDPAVLAQIELLEHQLARARALERAGKFDDGLAATETIVSAAEALGYGPVLARALLRKGLLEGKVDAHRRAEDTLSRAYSAGIEHRVGPIAAEAASALVGLVGGELARTDEGLTWAKHAAALAEAEGDAQILGSYLLNLARVARRRADHAAAHRHLERALSLWQQANGPNDFALAQVFGELGVTAGAEGALDDARRYQERALAIEERALGPDHPRLASTLVNLGNVEQGRGDFDRARAHYQRSLAIAEQAYADGHTVIAALLGNLGAVAQGKGDYAKARSYYQRALVMFERGFGSDHPRVTRTLANLGNIAALSGAHDDALDYLEHALSIEQRTLGPEHPETARTVGNIGGVLYRQAKYQQARVKYTRAIALHDKALPPEHPAHARVLTGMGKTLIELGRPHEALAGLERAVSLRENNTTSPAALAESRFALARALWSAPADAGRDRTRAIDLARRAEEGFAADGKRKASQRAAAERWLADRRH